uniref:ESPR-type extended signal peptide-containing protein n=1 Tax=Neisseria sicca TaxID=490 RepID=UPI00131C92EB
MNKIFKVVWNRTIGSFVVTSELAKGRVKSSSEGAEGDVRASEEGRLKTLFRLTALSAALLGFSEGAWATIPEGSVAGGAVLAIGTGSTSANGTGSMSIGHNAQAKINGGLAIGPNSTHTTISNGNNAIAIGVNLRADGTKAIGIGADTTVNGVGAIAIGNNDSTRMTNQGVQGNGAIGVGSNLTVRGNNAIAVGTEAQAKEISTVAVGANTQATGAEAVAIGKGAQATKKSSIAIGKNTQAIEESAIVIGSDDPLYGEIKSSSRQGIAIGVGAKATGATQSIALGPDAIASGTQSTSIGNNTRATGDSSIAIGGDDWNIVRTKQVAAAGNKLVHQVFEELTGMPMKQQGEAYGNPFKGTTAGDAAVAIGVAALAEGALSTAFGSGASASGVGAAAFGVGATASQNKSVAIGAGSHTRTDATAVTTATVNGITYGGFAGTTHITPGSQVSFGSTGFERQLKHVAPGAITSTSTDAINGSQLYALHVGSGNIAKAVADALGGNAAVGIDSTNNQGTVTLPSYDVFKGNATPNATGNSATKFNTAAATNVGGALTNLNTYVNQGFAVKDNAGAEKGIVTPGESVQFADGNAATVTVDTEANGNTKVKYDVQVDGETVKIKNGKLTAASQTHFYSVKNEDQTKGNYNNDGATGDNALAAGVDASATANGTTAVGLKAQASAESAIAVGSETKAAAKNAVVIGNKASVEAATGSVANVNGTTTGEGSVAVGAASKASGTNATAVGQAANAFGQNSFAGGQNSKASGKSSVAIGDGANATDDSSSAVGPYAQATKSGASAFGYYANALGENSLAAGRNAQATNANAVALGNESKATGQNTIAFGNNANASQNQAMALGRNTVASAGYTVALGDEAKATATKAIAFGSSAQATGTNSVATGVQAKAHANDALAVGSNANASGESAIAFGSSAQATGTNSVATGVQAKAHADDALAVGSNANASGESAIALGKQSNAWKVNSLAFGNSANSNGERAIAIGLESVSNGQNAVSVGQKAYAHEHGVAIGSESNAAQAAAIAIGNKAQAMKYSSIVIGEEAKSNNSRSVVIGYHASATNPAMSASNQDTNQTVAIGAYANAWGDQSTAIGNNVDAKGNSSIAIGADDWDTVAVKTVAGTGKTVKQVYQDYTGDVMETGDDTYTHTTSGEAAVAIGTKSQATAELSTAFGTGTRAEGVASAAFGMGAKATKGNSVAIGAGSTTATDATSVNEATVNNLKYSGFAGGNNVNPGDQVSFGTAGYERQLKNVAPGEISSASTDAINGSQLYAVQNVLGNTAKTVKDVLGGNAKLAEDGSLTTRDIGGTGQNTIDAAIRELNTNAYKPFKLTIAKTGGTNGVSENHTLQDVTSGSTITLEAGKNIALRQNGATVSINTVDNPEFTGKVTAKGGLDMGGNKITNVLSGTDTKDAVNLGQLQDAMANLRVSTLTTVNNDAPFSYVGTDGRILRREVTVDQGTGVKTVSFKHIDDNTPYIGDVTIAALNPTDPQTTTPTTVGNVKNGAKDNDAVNVSQLNKIAEAIGTKVNPDGTITAPTYNVISGDPSKASVANYNKVGDALTALSSAVRTPLYFEGDSGEKIDRLLGSTVAVKGGQNNADKLSENNIGVVADKNSGTLNVKLAKELTGLTSAAFSGDVTTAGTTVNGSGVTIGSGSNPVSLTAGGLSNGGNRVTNIADGAVDTDAASYKQVKAAKTEVQAGTNVAEVKKTDGADGQAIYTVNAKGAAVSAEGADNGLKLTSSENTTTNVTTYNLDLSDKTKASLTKADSALQNIGVQVNGADAKTLTKDDSTLNFVDGTGTTAENKNGTVAFNVNKSTLTAGTDGTVNAGKTGDAFATAADVAQAINEAVANSEKTSVVAAGDNTHVAAVEAGNKTTYTVHADNTTVSVKDGGKLKLGSSEKVNANQTKTTNYELDLTDDAKAEIQKGVDAKNIVDTKGITFNGNSGSPVTKKLDETLAIKGDDKNVVTEAGTDGIKVKLKDEITVQTVNADKLKAGDSVLTNDGLNIANGDNPVSLTKSGLNNGGNKITKVAKGENEDDAVNYAQLKELADKGLTFDADGNTSTSSKKLGERVGIKGGNNITTSADSDNVTVKLNDDITLNSVTATTLKAGDSTLTNAGLVTPKVTAGNSVLTTDGLKIGADSSSNQVSLTNSGLNNGGNKITKVAKGTDDTDAVNVEQIKPFAAALNTTVGADGTVGKPSFTVKQADGTAGTAVHTVQDALNKVSDELNKGLNIAADNGNADKVNLGETVTYTSKDKNIVTTVGSNEIDFSLAEKITIGKTDGKKVVIDGTNGTVSGLTNKTLGDTGFATKGQAATEEQINAAQTNLADVLGTGSTNQNGTVTVTDIGETGKTTVSDAIKSVKETAEKGWNLQANSDAAEKVAAGETVTFKDGKNIKVTRDGKNITVATSDDVEFNKVTVGGSELTGAGLNTPKVTAGDSELNGSGLTISNGTAGSSVSLTKNGLNNGGNKITKVAEGALAVDSTDAVNGAQLYRVDQKADTNAANIAKGIRIGGTNDSNKYALGDTVNIKGDSNITSETVEGGVQLKLADTVKIGQDTGKPVSIDGTTGTVSGLSNTTLGGTGFATSNKAATEAQLDATQANLKTILGGNAENTNGNIAMSNIGGTNQNTVHDAIKFVKETAEKGWKLKVNEETSAQAEKISPDDEVAIKQGKNITVTREGKNITVATSDDVAFNKVTVGDSVLNGNGLTIANGAANAPVSLTKNGLDNGGNKIAKVAKGTADTDAVNVEQLKPIATALNTTVNPTTGEVAAPAFTVTKADGTKNTAVGTVQEALDKVGEELKKGLVIAADAGSSEKVNLGDTVTYTGTDGNIKTKTLSGGKVDFGLSDKVTLGKTGGTPIVLDGTNGTVSGLTNKTLGGTDFATKGQAATEEQLNASQMNLKTILGGNAENTNGNIATSNIGGTNQNTVHDAIKSVKETVEKGWKLQANDDTEEKVAAGETVNFKDGKNIKVTRDGKNITVATSEDVEFNAVNATNVIAETVIAGNSVLTTEGLKIGADNSPSQVSLTTAGLNNGGNKIANVAKGTEDTDGVNVSQIKPLAEALNTTVGADGSVAAPDFTVKQADGTVSAPVHTVQDALDKVGDELNKGLKIAADNGDADKVNLGETVTYTSKDKNIVTTVADNKIDFSLADKITVGKAGQNPVVIDGVNGTVSGLTNKTLGGADFATSNKAATEAQLDATQVNLKNILGGEAKNENGNVSTANIGDTGKGNVHDAIKSVKETAEKGWNLQANEGAEEKVAAGETVNFKDGKNIKVTRDGKNITVATSEDVEFNAVNATNVIAETVIAGNSVLTTEGLKIGADNSPNQVSLTTAGLNNGGNKIANVAKGTADTDAVNVSQLNPIAKVLNTSINSTTGAIDAPVFTVTKADGTKHDAVGTVQDALDKVGEEVTKGLNIVADNGSSEKVNLGDTVTYTSKDKNIVTTSGTGKAIDFSLAEKVTIGKDAANGGKPVVIDGKEGIVSGLSNTTLGGADFATSNKAATEEQLNASQANLKNILGGNAANGNGNVTTSDIGGTGKDNVNDAIAAVKETVGKGWNLKANDEADSDSENIASGDTVTVKQGKNIRVKRSGKELTIETSDDVEFGTVSATTVLADSFISGNSVLSGEGLKIGADGSPSQVSLTNAGLNNGGNKIANVAKGTADTDAVNVAQLNEQLAATEKTTTVVAGKNVTVSEKVDGNNTEYT